MREFEFKPIYYEWHLTDKATGKLLHVMADPAEYTVHEDDGTDMTLEELVDFCYSDLDTADYCYSDNTPYNGLILYGLDCLTDDELKAASELMGKALYDYYIKSNEDSDGEPLQF